MAPNPNSAGPILDGVAQTNGVALAYEIFGAADAPPVLLIMGNSAPGLVWPDSFCARLASSGFRVVRFDQRDSDLSTYVDYDVQPYTLVDLVGDAIGLLDALGIGSAHIVGLSQGGVVAYRIALNHPERVLSLGVIMSSPDLGPKNDAFSGAPPKAGGLPRPTARYVEQVIALNGEPATGVDAIARRFVDNFRLASGSASPLDEAFWADLGRSFAERPLRRKDGLVAAMANNSNNARAQKATEPLSEEDLGLLHVPVTIIHGAEDPIFPIDHARWAAGIIDDANLVVIDAMGHALDPAFFEPIAAALVTCWRGETNLKAELQTPLPAHDIAAIRLPGAVSGL